ncbi:MAG: DUF3352 domain-containing protein, partial [Thermomicrobiales bacterium]
MAAGAAFGFGPNVARAQTDDLDTAALAPDATLIYISASLDSESEQWAQAEELLARLGLDSVEDALSGASETATGSDMAGLEDLDPFLGGTIGLVITSLAAAQEAGAGLSSEAGLPGVTGALPVGSPEASADGASQGFAAIVQPSDIDAAWTTFEEQLQGDATDAGTTVTEEDYQGVTISSVPGDESSGSSGTAAAQIEDFIIVGPTVADVQAIVDVQQGNAGALADEEHFQELSAAFTEPRLAFFYVNGPAAFAESMGSAEMAGFGEMGQFGDMLANSINAYSAATVSAADAGFRFDSLTMPGEGGELPPMPANFTPTLPDKVPS